MTTKTIKKAPPMSERPRCRYCGRRLKPCYRTDAITVEVPIETERAELALARAVKQFQDMTREERDNPVRVTHRWKGEELETQAGKHNLRETDDGWVVVMDTGDAERRWTDRYGGYGDSRFCGLNCGYRWAVLVDTKLSKRKTGSFVCFDQEKVDG